MRYKLEEILNRIRGGLIVSCQALEGEPLHGSEYMAKMAKAAFQGGAVAIRANSPEDIKAIKREVPLPVIGLYKVKYDDSPVYITPTFKEASLLAEADMIAIDATAQPRPGGEDLKELIRRIHNELHLPILADVSNSEEGIKAASYGADLISTALSGYVNCEVEPESPDFELVRALSQKIEVPILAEGRIHFPHEAAELLNLGAYAIVIGGAITRPQEITKRFVRAIEKDVSQYAVGIDIGGTNTKLGIVNGIGEVIINKSKKTDAKRGGAALLSSLVDWIGELLDEANVPITGIGLGSPGAINSKTGKVVWASENLPGWGGTELAKTLINKYKVPVRVTNDVNAVALGERWRGAAKGHRNVICITLGTGIGAGIICDGKLLEGAIGYAGEIGHICVEMNGRECTCGLRGCLEAYASATGLLKSINERAPVDSVEELFRGYKEGNPLYIKVVDRGISYLGSTLGGLANTFNPEVIVIGGGIANAGEWFISKISDEARNYMLPITKSLVKIAPSALRDRAGIIGSAGLILS